MLRASRFYRGFGNVEINIVLRLNRFSGYEISIVTSGCEREMFRTEQMASMFILCGTISVSRVFTGHWERVWSFRLEEKKWFRYV